ncbi:hypothetical protein D1AOALGA4SA_3864 [Olavius algarvensis Delta 1 endosymbiont]|nr:hypothetical protein D1AOALGA4SA_3864 [Olavius algarvensis Delta 1 endosymbiont]
MGILKWERFDCGFRISECGLKNGMNSISDSGFGNEIFFLWLRTRRFAPVQTCTIFPSPTPDP